MELFLSRSIDGRSVFKIDWSRQALATDVNNDGLPLTIEDFVYFARVVNGDNKPLDQITKGSFSAVLNILQTSDEISLVLSSEKNIAAVSISIFAPAPLTNISISDSIDDMTTHFFPGKRYFRVFIYDLNGNYIPAGETELIRFEHPDYWPSSISFHATGYYGEEAKVSLDYLNDNE